MTSRRPDRPHLAEGRSGQLYGGRRRSRARRVPPLKPRRRIMRRRRRGPSLRTVVVAALLGLGLFAAVSLARDSQRHQEPPPAATPTPAVPPPTGTASPTPTPTPQPANGPLGDEDPYPPVFYTSGRATGLPYSGGRLIDGTQLPEEGEHFFTWDPVKKRSPNRGWRRWGTDALVRLVLETLEEFHADHPEAQRIGIGDLSRPKGGDFGRQYGSLGHASHQNGLDVDIYYPRRDGLERRPNTPAQVDQALSQDLVDRFVEKGAEKVFVGPNLSLTGPKDVVSKLIHHDDHLHVRIRNPASRKRR